MAQSGYTPILVYASGTASNVPLAANLTSSANGAELALNYADGKLYFKNSSGVVTLLASSATAGSGVTTFSAGTTGLTPNSATSGAVTLAGTLVVGNGGTGLATLTANNVILGNGTSTPLFVAPGTSGNVLTSNGTTWQSTAPATGTTISFGTTGLTPSTATGGAVTVAGTLATANGGTGSTTLTANSVMLGNGTSALSSNMVAPGTSGNVLTSNGTTWTSAAGMPVGTIITYAGTSAPTGFLLCPTSLTNVSRTTYAALFAAIGTTWGAGDGSTTFGLPWFAADYAMVQASSNVGTATVGQVIAHTHTAAVVASSLGTGGKTTGSASSSNTGSTGGSANLAAGVRVLTCVKY